MAPKITDQDKIDFLLLYIEHGNDMKKVREVLGNMPRQTAEARFKAIKDESKKRRAAAGTSDNASGDQQPAVKKSSAKKPAATKPAATKPAAKKRKRNVKQESEEPEADGDTEVDIGLVRHNYPILKYPFH